MKNINLAIILVLILSIFNFSPIDTSEKSSQTLLEQVLDQSDPEKEKDDKFIGNKISICHAFSMKPLTAFQLACTTTYAYINTLFRPPILS